MKKEVDKQELKDKMQGGNFVFVFFFFWHKSNINDNSK
jgi:hypothetical protein